MNKTIDNESVHKYMEDLSDDEKVYVAWKLSEYLKQYVVPVGEKYEKYKFNVEEMLKYDNKRINKILSKLAKMKENEELHGENTNYLAILIIISLIIFAPGVLRNFSSEELCALGITSGISVLFIKKIFDKVYDLKERKINKMYKDLDESQERALLCDKTLNEAKKLSFHYNSVKNTISDLINN